MVQSVEKFHEMRLRLLVTDSSPIFPEQESKVTLSENWITKNTSFSTAVDWLFLELNWFACNQAKVWCHIRTSSSFVRFCHKKMDTFMYKFRAQCFFIPLLELEWAGNQAGWMLNSIVKLTGLQCISQKFATVHGEWEAKFTQNKSWTIQSWNTTKTFILLANSIFVICKWNQDIVCQSSSWSMSTGHERLKRRTAQDGCSYVAPVIKLGFKFLGWDWFSYCLTSISILICKQ